MEIDWQGTTIMAIFIGLIISFMLYNRLRWQKQEAEREKAATIAWATDYHNPASPTYDAARIAAEQAAAWAQDPTNPESPNYNPNA